MDLLHRNSSSVNPLQNRSAHFPLRAQSSSNSSAFLLPSKMIRKNIMCAKKKLLSSCLFVLFFFICFALTPSIFAYPLYHGLKSGRCDVYAVSGTICWCISVVIDTWLMLYLRYVCPSFQNLELLKRIFEHADLRLCDGCEKTIFLRHWVLMDQPISEPLILLFEPSFEGRRTMYSLPRNGYLWSDRTSQYTETQNKKPTIVTAKGRPYRRNHGVQGWFSVNYYLHFVFPPHVRGGVQGGGLEYYFVFPVIANVIHLLLQTYLVSRPDC